MTETSAVAIVGAGPYGLSVAAHLAAHQLRPMIFGASMKSWRHGMPSGMRLKSEGFASSLSDPGRDFTLKAFCEEQDLSYADTDLPVPVETFVAYGDAFQKRFVPQLDPREVRHIARAPHGFTLRLEDGTRIDTRRVILATGIEHYRHIPRVLAGLPRTRISHTCERADYSMFSRSRVVVIGAGASAIDTAGALKRAGADVSLVSRGRAIRFYPGGGRSTILDRLRAPATPLGPGWKKLFCVKAPLLFRLLPERLRVLIVQRYLGPAPGYFVRDDVEGKVPYHLSSTITDARETANGVTLDIVTASGHSKQLEADHVIAGTGFSVDMDRLSFLDPGLIADLALTQKAPKLSSRFETSVQGLHVVGTAAAYEFGPMLRFVCGADFAARRIAKYIASVERRRQTIGFPGTTLLAHLYKRTPADRAGVNQSP